MTATISPADLGHHHGGTTPADPGRTEETEGERRHELTPVPGPRGAVDTVPPAIHTPWCEEHQDGGALDQKCSSAPTEIVSPPIAGGEPSVVTVRASRFSYREPGGEWYFDDNVAAWVEMGGLDDWSDLTPNAAIEVAVALVRHARHAGGPGMPTSVGPGSMGYRHDPLRSWSIG